MKSNYLLVLFLLLPAWLTACQAPVESSDRELFVFGTVVEISIRNAPAGSTQAALADLENRFQSMHREWHAWEPGTLTRINAALARGEVIAAPADIRQMVLKSQDYEQQSEGCFNPAIGGLIALWGFHTSEYPVLGSPPGAGEIQRWLQTEPSTLDIVIDGDLMSTNNPAVQLDFGGIAKGLAVDTALETLTNHGIENAIVNAGGDLKVSGSHGDRPWRVAVRNPFGGIIGGLEVHPGEAVFTSGNYERFRADEEQRYPHIIDPRSGWPVEQVSSVTVVTEDAVLADAAATAITVAGPRHWRAVARNMGVDRVLMLSDSGEMFVTPELHQRIEYREGIQPLVTPLD